jgi:hypothetical protein
MCTWSNRRPTWNSTEDDYATPASERNAYRRVTHRSRNAYASVSDFARVIQLGEVRDMRSMLFAVAGVVLVVAAAVVSAALAVGMPGAAPSGVTRADLRGVNFVEACAFSHRAPDDPIVFPGKPGASHDHTFVGNRTTNAYSTFGSLRSAGTTCRRAADTAAYWIPTLYQGSNPVLPVGATIYYRRATLAEVRSFPNGLRMIAGDSKAITPQSLRITYWNCGVTAGVPPSSAVPTCPDARGSFLRLHVRFPNCWDGKDLDSSDHRSHLAYSVRGTCPAGYPTASPAIELIYRYPTLGGTDFSLSSMGQYSGHADFFNAWNPGALKRLVDGCLNALVHCGQG